MRKINPQMQAQEWEEKYSSDNYFRECHSSLAKLVSEIIGDLRGKRILELGCGQGQDAVYFGKNGAVVTAIDFSDSAVESTKAKINELGLEREIHVIKSDISYEPLPEETYDIVFANISLHYFHDEATKRVFGDIYKRLVQNGYLFFEVKSTEDIDYGKGEKIERDFFDNKGKRRHFFSMEYLLKCVEQYHILSVQSKKYVSEGKLSSFLTACVQKPS